MKISTLFSILIFTCSIQGQIVESKIKEQSTISICDIYKTPQNYVNKKIKVLAIYKGALMMPALLIDKSCEDISLFLSLSCNEKKICESLKERMNKAFFRGDISKQSESIYFVGVLRKNSIKANAPIDGILQNYTMHIKEIMKLKSYQHL